MVFCCNSVLQANAFLQEKPTREFLGNSTPCQFSGKQVPRPVDYFWPDDLISRIVIGEPSGLKVITVKRLVINEYRQGRRCMFCGDVVNAKNESRPVVHNPPSSVPGFSRLNFSAIE